jgi:hypothetical protein
VARPLIRLGLLVALLLALVRGVIVHSGHVGPVEWVVVAVLVVALIASIVRTPLRAA